MSAAIDEATPEDLEFSPSFRHRMGKTIGGMAVGSWIALLGIALGTIVAIETSLALDVLVCLVILAIAASQMGTSLWGLLNELLESIKAKMMNIAQS